MKLVIVVVIIVVVLCDVEGCFSDDVYLYLLV